jgi:hypothetical protein
MSSHPDRRRLQVCGASFQATSAIEIQRVAHGSLTGYAFVLGPSWITVSGADGHELVASAMSMSEPSRSAYLLGVLSGLLVGDRLSRRCGSA